MKEGIILIIYRIFFIYKRINIKNKIMGVGRGDKNERVYSFRYKVKFFQRFNIQYDSFS